VGGAETPTEDDLPLVRDFKQSLQQIPQATRTAREEVWQSQPRRQQDGTFGYFVTDHLWVVFSSSTDKVEDDDDGVDLKSLFSPTYFEDADGVRDANEVARNAVAEFRRSNSRSEVDWHAESEIAAINDWQIPIPNVANI
jgi:hypothetical protein